MLTVKAPITLKCDRMMVPSHEAFYHKITDSYQLMTASITGEDLLHVVTAPPEVYLGEGGMTNIVSNTQVQNIRETNLNVINNLLNRIALTEDVNLTYRDRVYITDVLNKLGIKNVQEFMTQVERIKQETNTAEHLISLYWNHADELSWILETYQDLRREERTESEEVREDVRIHLHEDIMNRLQTGAVYQILSNFYAGHAAANTYVTNQELQIAEQRRTASQILLTRLKNVVRDRQTPLIYRHENYYENMDLEELNVNRESVSTQITSAVLLGLVDNLYFSRFERQQNAYDNWLVTQNALYQSAQNTIQRLRMETGAVREIQNRRERSVYQRDLREMELFSTLQLLQPQPAEEEEEIAEKESAAAGEIRELYDFYDRVETYLRATDAVTHEAQTVFERVQTAYRETEAGSGQEDQSPAEEERLPLPGETVYQQEVSNRLLTREYESPLERITEIRGEQEPPAPPREADIIRTEGDSYTYLTEAEEMPEESRQREESEQIIQQLRRIDQQNIENYNRYLQLLAEREEQTVRRGERPQQRTRRESLLALENPQQMMEERRQEREQAAQRGEERIREFIKLLPEETQRVYERLEQYRENPERFRQSGEISRDNVGLLMRDIQEIERERALASRIEREETQQEQIREVSETVLERWRDQPPAVRRERRQDEFSQTDVSLVHKSVENTLDEELLQELIAQNRSLRQQTTVTENVRHEERTVNRTVHEVREQTQEVEQRNISELVRQGIQSQIRPLSEQVYSRLEKRLLNEKRRRGY